MTMSLNRVTLLGYVGQEPEFHTTSNGKQLANLSIATTEQWKDKDTSERREKTEWHRVVVFNENVVRILRDYVVKGSRLLIEGSLQTRKWQDKNGNDRSTTEIVLQGFNSKFMLLDSKSDRNRYANQNVEQQNSDSGASFGQTQGMFDDNNRAIKDKDTIIPEDLDDEIPF